MKEKDPKYNLMLTFALIIVLAFMIIGNGIRDALDIRNQK